MELETLGKKDPRTYRFCSIVPSKRLDTYLTEGFGHFSRAFFQHLLKTKEHITINGKSAKATTSVHIGDIIALTLPKLKTLDIVAEDIPLDIVYEDDAMLIINKAPGIVVHPTEKGGHYSGTLVNALLHHRAETFSGVKGERRPGIVHRLDKDTSGILVIAKNDHSLMNLSKQFQDRKTYKEYLTLVRGRPSVAHGKIDSPIGRSEIDRKKMAVSGHSSARHALTEFWVEAVFAGVSLVRVQIHTGRTHQIRVHLASIGHPVLGDETYGDQQLNTEFREHYGLTRQFLHAWKLGLYHPVTGEWCAFEATLAPDLQSIVNVLEKSPK